jgi:hypothetical protein
VKENSTPLLIILSVFNPRLMDPAGIARQGVEKAQEFAPKNRKALPGSDGRGRCGEDIFLPIDHGTRNGADPGPKLKFGSWFIGKPKDEWVVMGQRFSKNAR